MKTHQKHSKLTRRTNGNYAPLEICILGASCDIIESLVSIISEKLSPKFKIAYLDASHKEEKKTNFSSFTYAENSLTNISQNTTLNTYQAKIDLASFDLCFINGNHFKGENQIVLLDAKKENSIVKRIDQIDNPICFIQKVNEDVFPTLKEKFLNYKEIPLLNFNNLENIIEIILKTVKQQVIELNGLVLTGGKSTRMGSDKSKLDYFGKEHSVFLAELLEQNALKTFYSQRKNTEGKENVIEDKFIELGPFGAICSAFMHNPNKAYLVLATDLPFVDDSLIKRLISERDASKIATAIIGEDNEFPEPLICIWEPKAYPKLLAFLSQGYSCPRKVLINSNIKTIRVEEKLITNVNDRETYEKVKQQIK